MKLWSIIGLITIMGIGCGVIEDSEYIPKPGTYISEIDRSGYISRLIIAKRDKGYDITFIESSTTPVQEECRIDASGKKSSYGIWVEIPAYGPRLPVIIREREGTIDVLLKGPGDPRETFQYCLTERTPAGIYKKKSN